MGVSCQILIKPSNDGKFIIGQSIIGVVRYSLNKPTQYKRITLSLIGKGRCKWIQQKKTKGPGAASNLIKYEGHEKILVEKTIIDDKRHDLTINTGMYEHPFEINLPLNVPPSVNTEVCEVQYYIALTFEKPSVLKMPKHFRTRNIIINPNIPVSIPDQPISFGIDKTLMRPFSKKRKQKIQMKGKLNNSFMSPGRDSKIDFVITNNSDVSVSVQTELISKIVYRDDCGNAKNEEAVVKELNSPKVLENSKANLFKVIPVWTDLYTIRCSKLMSREYKLRMTVKLPLPHINATVEMPIVIGERHNEVVTPIEEPVSYWEVMREDYSKD